MAPTPIDGYLPSAMNSPTRSDNSNTILFDTSKHNQFGVNDGYRNVHRLLKNRWRVANTKDNLTIESLTSSRLVVLVGPQEKYNEAEFNALRQFVDQGGNLLVLLGEGGEQQFNTNINFLLEEYGIMINNGKSPFHHFKCTIVYQRPFRMIYLAIRCRDLHRLSEIFPPKRMSHRRSSAVDIDRKATN